MSTEPTYDADRAFVGVNFTCDTCATNPEFYHGESFRAALDAAKADGWRAWKDDAGNWCHACPGCTGKESI